MEKRIGWSATTVSISAGIVLAIYEVMGWKMPILIANVLIAITSLAGFIAVIVLCHAIWVWSRPIRGRYSIRIYDRTKHDPNQWLYDRAKEQKDNPCIHLVVTERVIQNWDLEAKRPHITLRVSYTNLGLYDLEIGRPEGIAYYNNNQLPDRIHNDGGHNNVGVNVSSHTAFDVYIPKEFVEDIHKEISTGELKGLSLQNVRAKVKIVGNNEESDWALDWGGNIFRPRQ